MQNPLPRLTQSARLGERGVGIVSRIVNESFLWLFKRTHQEHDFGIDGSIDLITPDGHLTGQTLSLQIKCGKSFFQEKTEKGYIYRGELKHFNFLSNQASPVLIIICHPDSEICYWTKFDPADCTRTESAWKLVIPFGNKLSDSKSKLEALLPKFRDQLEELQKSAILAAAISETSYIYFIIDKKEVKAMDVSRPRAFFDSLRRTKELAMAAQGKVEIAFHGYNNDSRELFKIEEIRMYMPLLDFALHDLFFFAKTTSPTHTIKMFALCQAELLNEPSLMDDGRLKIECSKEFLSAFSTRHWPSFNELTDWLDMPVEKNKEISYAVMNCLDMDMSAKASSE